MHTGSRLRRQLRDVELEGIGDEELEIGDR